MKQIFKTHPVLDVLTPERMAQLGYDETVRFLKLRDEKIRLEREDPVRYGFEPAIWRVCDALLGLPWLPREEAAEIRKRLGFHGPVDILLAMGANRSGKSQYAARTFVKMLLHKPEAIGWAYHENNANSIEMQQPYIEKFLPAELRKKPLKTKREYIVFSMQNGFSEGRFTLPNLSRASFRNYEQDEKKSEGGEPDIVWPDELCPAELMEALKGRLATRRGKLLATFTPVEGYSGTVRLFLDGAETVLESVGWLCPAKGGPRAEAPAFGLEEGHYGRVQGMLEGTGPEVSVWARPESLEQILAGPDALDPERRFERVPRVARCLDPKRAVVWFHGRDNPYGNPVNVLNLWRKSSPEKLKERLYGIAHKAIQTRFPKFEPRVHVIPAAALPAEATQFTTYMLMDPASARNPVMKWFRKTRDKTYLAREWPGGYHIPGAPIFECGPGPGPWAIPDGRKPDGARGPAQKPFGFGLLRIKSEIARLEGWADWKQDVLDLENGRGRKPVLEWRVENGTDERVFERFIDSRAASSPRVENDRPVTLQEEFERIGLQFHLTPGMSIEEGVAKINDALDWDAEKERDWLNSPAYFIADSCQNTIFAYQTWTGLDGNKGACKDFIDLDCYYWLLGLEFRDETRSWVTPGRGAY